MAFSFGQTPAPAAPAPSGGSFSFGSTTATTAAPAPSTGFSFGGSTTTNTTTTTTTTPAPAPTFGAAPTPGGLFGQAPAPSGFSFGSSTATPAPSTGLFGSTTPAPASGGLFGRSPAPASGGLFGSTAPAPAPSGGGLFGSAPTAPAAPQPAAPSMISGQTPYSALPDPVKKAIDAIHEQIMRHKRTTIQLENLSPTLLRETGPTGGGGKSLADQLGDLKTQMSDLESTIKKSHERSGMIKEKFETTIQQVIVYGVWPVEAVAVRRGVKLSSQEIQTDPTVQDQLRRSLELQSVHIDRLEKIPSPYFWQTVESMETRLKELEENVQAMKQQIEQLKTINDVGLVPIVQAQTEALGSATHAIHLIHHRVENLIAKYNTWETGENVLEEQKMKDFTNQQKVDDFVKMQYVMAGGPATVANQAPPPPPGGTGLFGATAPAPSGGLFGTPAPAPSGGLFGTPAPAPSGGLFGTPAPAPSGGLFGTPAPAPAAGGGLFGANTPAPPPPGGLVGNKAPAPTPTPTPGGLFGGAATPAPAPGLFGGTPAPAPGLFGGAATPAPAPGLFGGTPAPAFGSSAPATSFFTSSTSSTPKSRTKPRGNRRK